MSTSSVTIRTGLQGHGKTLNTLIEVHEANGGTIDQPGVRAIYYHGIRDLTLPGWSLLDDPQKWFELPSNSIIVVDESQKHWPAKGMSKGEPPPSIAALETLRHMGHNLNLITQDAKLLDHRIRRLCGQHIHYFRPFGASRTTRTEWQRVVNPFDFFAKKEAISTKVIKLDKKYFAVYKSAEVHTVKRKIPKKFLLIPFLLALVSAAGYGLYNTLSTDDPVVLSSFAGSSGEPVASAPSPFPASAPAVIYRVSGVIDAGGGVLTAFVQLPDGHTVTLRRARCWQDDTGWACQHGEHVAHERYASTADSLADKGVGRERAQAERPATPGGSSFSLF